MGRKAARKAKLAAKRNAKKLGASQATLPDATEPVASESQDVLPEAGETKVETEVPAAPAAPAAPASSADSSELDEREKKLLEREKELEKKMAMVDKKAR